MSDEEVRRLERICASGGTLDDQVSLLRMWVRQGTLRLQVVQALAALGSPMACAVLCVPRKPATLAVLLDALPAIAELGREHAVRFGVAAVRPSLARLPIPWSVFGVSSLSAVESWLRAPDASHEGAVSRWTDPSLRAAWFLAEEAADPQSQAVEFSVREARDLVVDFVTLPARLVAASDLLTCLQSGFEQVATIGAPVTAVVSSARDEFGGWALLRVIEAQLTGDPRER